MSNKESCAPVGLLDILKEIKTSRNKLDDLTERMQTAMDSKRDASSMSDELQEVMKRNQAMWKSGYDEGFKAGRDSEMQASEKRDRELLEEHGIDVDKHFADTSKFIEDRDDDDIDEDEPDQYPPEKWGGTK
jgi:formate-dependent nitrite reductase cytochrome c552 subunit